MLILGLNGYIINSLRVLWKREYNPTSAIMTKLFNTTGCESVPFVPEQEVQSDGSNLSPVESGLPRELPLVAEVTEAIVVFERNGIEVRASLKPGEAEGEPYFIETELLGPGEPLTDRFHMIVDSIKVIGMKGSTNSVEEGSVIAPAHLHPVKDKDGLKLAIKGKL